MAFTITFAIGPWPNFQPSERVVHGAAETVSPSPGGEGRGEGGLQIKIKLPFRIFRPALRHMISLSLGVEIININHVV
jgi:hypothetical protein